MLCGWFYHLDDEGLHLHAATNPYSPYADREGAQGPFFRGDDADQVTQHLLQSRAWMLEKLADYRARHPDQSVQIITPPTIPTFRMTRRLVGAISLGERHDHHHFEDSVGLTGDWRRRGPVYAFPLRSLAGVANDNLLAAGRCMSADTTAWDVTRALPGCAVTGEAAGTAAAMLADQPEPSLAALSVPDLHAQLSRQGVILEY